MRHLALLLAVASLTLVGVAGCGRTSLPCGPNTCTGCCDTSGECQAGSANQACGAAGAKCSSCVLCVNQSCVGSTGGGNATGGGASNGGGSSVGGGSFGGGSAFGGGGEFTGGGSGTGGGFETGGGSFAGGPAGGGSSGGGSFGGGPTGGGTGLTSVFLTRVEPGLIYIIDNSASMAGPVDPQSMGCVQGCGGTFPCPPGCLTRSRQVKNVINTLTTNFRNSAMQALVTYPQQMGGAACGNARSEVELPVNTSPTELQNRATVTNAIVANLVPQGGTPTRLALDEVLGWNLTSLPQREMFAVLLTDGPPNCNAANPQSNCNGSQACTCTIGSGANTCSGAFCAIGCVDNTVTGAAQQLAARGVKVMVVGVGDDINAPQTLRLLTDIGANGQLLRACSPPSLGCGDVGICGSSGFCTSGVYTLNNTDEVQVTIRAITRQVEERRMCRYLFDPVTPPTRIDVGSQTVPRGNPGWEIDSTGARLNISGNFCDLLIATNGLPAASR